MRKGVGGRGDPGSRALSCGRSQLLRAVGIAMAWIRMGRREGQGQKWAGRPLAEPAEPLCIGGSKMHVPTLCRAREGGSE